MSVGSGMADLPEKAHSPRGDWNRPGGFGRLERLGRHSSADDSDEQPLFFEILARHSAEERDLGVRRGALLGENCLVPPDASHGQAECGSQRRRRDLDRGQNALGPALLAAQPGRDGHEPVGQAAGGPLRRVRVPRDTPLSHGKVRGPRKRSSRVKRWPARARRAPATDDSSWTLRAFPSARSGPPAARRPDAVTRPAACTASDVRR
jgi:hypothetical protein